MKYRLRQDYKTPEAVVPKGTVGQPFGEKITFTAGGQGVTSLLVVSVVACRKFPDWFTPIPETWAILYKSPLEKLEDEESRMCFTFNKNIEEHPRKAELSTVIERFLNEGKHHWEETDLAGPYSQAQMLDFADFCMKNLSDNSYVFLPASKIFEKWKESKTQKIKV
jgi:hypothetical protein